MKKLAVFAVAAALAASAFAEAGWLGNSYINVNGTWYQGSGDQNWGDAMDQDQLTFSGADYGTISSLLLGGQAQVWEDNGQGGGVNWQGGSVTMNYAIDNIVAAEPISMPWFKFGDEYGNNNAFQSGGADFATTAVDLSGLNAGSHNLQVWFTCDAQSDGTQAAPFTASFTTAASPTPAVPEPATMSLLGLGALAMVLRRKLRK